MNYSDGRPPSDDSPIFTSRRRQRGSNDAFAVVGLLVGGLVVAIGLVWWFFGRSPELPPMVGPDVPDSAGAQAADADSGLAMGPELRWDSLPPLESSDDFVRERAGTLSSDAAWRDWLGVDNLVERAVVTVASLSAGLSPAEQLPFLQPGDTFTVVERDGRTYVDPASYRRYDAMIRAITSVDIGLAARMYRGVGPLMQTAWEPLGFGDADMDTGLARALGVILSVDVQDRPIELHPSGVVWEYADPQLEALSDAEKHMLRLGPENARRLQSRARALANALGIEPIQPR